MMRTKENKMKEEVGLLKHVLGHYINSISNIEIVKSHMHGRDSCPHYEIQFEILPIASTTLYPLKDERHNHLIEKITLLPGVGEKVKIKAQINIQTIQRSANLLKEHKGRQKV